MRTKMETGSMSIAPVRISVLYIIKEKDTGCGMFPGQIAKRIIYVSSKQDIIANIYYIQKLRLKSR